MTVIILKVLSVLLEPAAAGEAVCNSARLQALRECGDIKPNTGYISVNSLSSFCLIQRQLQNEGQVRQPSARTLLLLLHRTSTLLLLLHRASNASQSHPKQKPPPLVFLVFARREGQMDDGKGERFSTGKCCR